MYHNYLVQESKNGFHCCTFANFSLSLSPPYTFLLSLAIYPLFFTAINEPLFSRGQIPNRRWNSRACDRYPAGTLGSLTEKVLANVLEGWYEGTFREDPSRSSRSAVPVSVASPTRACVSPRLGRNWFGMLDDR